MKLSQIQMRDPFVLPDAERGVYYLYGSTDKDIWRGPGVGFDVYTSRNLVDWEGPRPAFRPAKDFWGKKNFWAPEVHAYRGRYYMFASFKADGVCRGTQILAADTPIGPFLPHSNGPITPRNWECLDGTFFLDEDGVSWMVFCHEWVQVGDGEMCAVRLNADLSAPIGEPVVLFRASEADWAVELRGKIGRGKVTDGPFLHRTRSGKLLMLWSSVGREGYAMGVAVSASGNLLCPWEQQSTPLFGKDGGHGMLFRDFSGGLYMTLHLPNDTPNERPRFIPVLECDGQIQLDPSRPTL